VPTVEEMAEWAQRPENIQKGRAYVGKNRIREHFGVSTHKASQAAGIACAESNPDACQPAVEAADTLGLMRQIQQLKGRIDRYEELEKVFAKIFGELVTPLPAFRKGERELPKFKQGKATETLMQDASDWQVGMQVRPVDTMHLGGYNFEVFKKRLRYMRDTIITVYQEEIRVRPVKTLIINCIGDLLEGVNIFKSQAWFLDMHLVQQVLALQAEICQFVRDIASVIPEIRIYGVWGNHGRIGMKGENPPSCNAEFLLLLELQLMLRQLQGVSVFVSECPLMAYQWLGDIHLLAHGDKTRGWMGIPFYGLTRDTLKYVNLTQLPVRYVHYGHHHRQADWHESGVEVLLNGAMCGPTVLAVDDFKSAEEPIQMLYRVHPDHGLNWRCPIRFERREPMVADEDGIFTPVRKMKAEV